METRTPLYVRLPSDAADKLDRAAFELRTSKQTLVSNLVSRYVDPDTAAGLRALERMGGATRRLVVETKDDAVTVGRHSFVPAEAPEVMTVGDVAALLRVDEAAVVAMAEAGELPGRRIGQDWRFSRAGVLRWLGGDAPA